MHLPAAKPSRCQSVTLVFPVFTITLAHSEIEWRVSVVQVHALQSLQLQTPGPDSRLQTFESGVYIWGTELSPRISLREFCHPHTYAHRVHTNMHTYTTPSLGYPDSAPRRNLFSRMD